MQLLLRRAFASFRSGQFSLLPVPKGDIQLFRFSARIFYHQSLLKPHSDSWNCFFLSLSFAGKTIEDVVDKAPSTKKADTNPTVVIEPAKTEKRY